MRSILLGALCALMVSAGCGGNGTTATPRELDYVVAPEFGRANVLAPEHVQYGSTYGEWSARWWQWVFELPAAGHPLLDPTGMAAAAGQVDPVWFLGGALQPAGAPPAAPVVRTVTMPRGVALFFPIFALQLDNTSCVTPDTAFSFSELRRFAAERIRTVTDVRCTVDGVPVVDAPTYFDAQRWAAQAPEFSVRVPPDGVFAATCGDAPEGGLVGPIASDGLWMMIAPMPAGGHTVQLSANPGTGGGPVDVTYHITVLP